MKNNLLFFFFIVYFYTIDSTTQQLVSSDTSVEYKKFDIHKGFGVYSVSFMEFDNLGWLWVSGSNLELIDGKIHERSAIIQRYDGNRFYTVPLPNFSGSPPNFIKLYKRLDGQFYAVLIWQNKEKIFLLNPETLVFKEVILPSSKENKDICLFSYKDFFMVYVRHNTEIKLFQLNKNLKLTEYPTPITLQKENTYPIFSNFIGFEDHFILSESRSGVYIYNDNGTLLKKLTLSDLGLTNKDPNFLIDIDTWFKRDGNIYVYFTDIEGCYKYSSKNKKWEKTIFFDLDKTDKFNKQLVFSDVKENLIKQELSGVNSQFKFNFKNNFYRAPINTNFINSSKIASRDLSKELFIENKGSFYHYTFDNANVSTFLKNSSIRGMLQLNSNEVLVSTQDSGWFLINLKTKTTKQYKMTMNGQPFIPKASRAIFEDETNYWSSYDKGIISIDKKTQEVTPFIYYEVAAMVEDEKYIYYGIPFYNLMKFDKESKKNITLTSTSKYDVQGILKVGNSIYLACEEGLVVFENEKTTLYNPKEKQEHSIFISIIQHPTYGILLGTRTGELFQFNPQTKEFTLLYKDKLNASIATILFDNKDGIWMNTYNGIVSYNPETKASTRFTMNDGLSFYEANRYSALKTGNGFFLVGTLNGVSYFNPEELTKKVIDAEFRLTATTYFDKTLKKEIKEKSPQKLKDLKSISLPPESKNLELQFSLFGIYDSNKIKYRYRLNKELWVDLFTDTEIRLSNLSAGKHILEIEAIDSANKNIGKPIVLSIFAGEFFYKSDWFYFLFFLGIFVIIFWFYLEERKKHVLKENFSNKIISTQEEERSRIAKELHDSIGQRLLVLQKTFSKNKNQEETELKMINDVINEVRNISHNLHPFQFRKLGLAKSLENMMDAFQKSSEVFYSYEIDDDIDVYISKEKGLFIFRMLQECIANVEKHANATACNLTIINEAKIIRFVLKDNGSGFMVNNAMNSNESLGLKSLQERAQFISAILNIQSNSKTGTIITIKIAK
ncbi:sensor histidine kinase [Tenacibaculum adriaticum]|uniref:sensor histidine kinase n=1 Tax=Tenacibaculum adriaticum TaxID=413713 RepID=UPI0011E745B2|nr:histidine kinase [Tenacibaculum adriaticum]